jgi:hypothetical protein
MPGLLLLSDNASMTRKPLVLSHSSGKFIFLFQDYISFQLSSETDTISGCLQ